MSKEIFTALSELKGQPHSLEKITGLEALVREADVTDKMKLAYRVRLELIEAAVHGGSHEKAVVAFSWCLSQMDRQQPWIDPDGILWRYKWILSGIAEYPTIDRRKIDSMLDDFEQRLKTHGYSPKPVWKLRMELARKMGRIDESRTSFEQWEMMSRDGMSDCYACDLDEAVAAAVGFGDYEVAVERAELIVEGKSRCKEVPHLTYARVLLPMLRLKKFEEAAEYHNVGYPKISRNRDFLRPAAQHMIATAALADLPRGLRLLEKHLPWAESSSEQMARMEFYHAAEVLLARVSEKRSKARKLKLPSTLACYREDGTYVPGEVAEFFHQQATTLARQFDQRNGNNYYTTKFEADREFVLRECLPLTE